MVTITADLMQALLNVSDTDISNTNMEYVIDYAVNRLNAYGADLPNMTGTAASKTLSVESREAGQIQEATRLAYYSCYKGQESLAVGGIATSIPNMLTNPSVEAQFKEMARQLSEMDVSVV